MNFEIALSNSGLQRFGYDFEADPLEEIRADNFEIMITERMMQCIQPKQWLNGDVTSFYFQLVVQRSMRDLTLRRQNLPRKDQKMCFVERLFSNTNFLWYQFTRKSVNTLTRSLYFYDSLHEDAEYHLNLLKSFLHEFATEREYYEYNPSKFISFCPKDTAVQTITFDCGSFVCKFSEGLSSEVPMNFSPEEMPIIREIARFELQDLPTKICAATMCAARFATARKETKIELQDLRFIFDFLALE
uniref:Ubiquitin-like protease family profile domain-containing protein n=1 Tax=Ditylenchus dipsaci TaxID=166011 RepID=A0A915E1P9_9BILA